MPSESHQRKLVVRFPSTGNYVPSESHQRKLVVRFLSTGNYVAFAIPPTEVGGSVPFYRELRCPRNPTNGSWWFGSDPF